MLTDLFGFYKRNMKSMNKWQLKKDLKEFKQIQIMLERKLKELEEAI